MTTQELFGHLNPDDLVTLTQIMALNGDCPMIFGGWRSDDSCQPERAGQLGQAVRRNGWVYVCVKANAGPHLPNSHPDHVSCGSAQWVLVPSPQAVEWDYVPRVYHSREGWRRR